MVMMSVIDFPRKRNILRNGDLAIVIGFLLFNVLQVSAQRGPGGVGETDGSSNLIYWIDANQHAEVVAGNLTQISDLSGNDVQHTIIGNPTLSDNFVNQRAAINFNGVDQQLLTDIFINASLYPNLTVCAVYRPTVDYPGSVVGDYQTGWDGRYITNNTYDVVTANFVGPGYQPPDVTHPSTAIPGLFTTATWTISTVIYREDIVNGTEVRVNGQFQRAFTSDHDPGSFNYFTVGAGGSPAATYSFWYNGHVAEVIVFNEALNDLDLRTFENYLSAKYNIPLADNDLYTGDDTNFDYDVAGIGRVDVSTERTTAQGTGSVQIEGSSIEADEFLFWGHNNGDLRALETNDVPTGVEARSNRTWYVSEVNSSGAAVDAGPLNITFELGNLGPVTVSDLVLLIDTDGDGSFSDETLIGGAYDLGNNHYQFQNVTAITNGSRFTFGSSNVDQTPLPVLLLNFQARILNENICEFTWATASEHNNAYFEILKSKDGVKWQPIIKKNGAGNSNELKSYRVAYGERDEKERIYYALRQVDFDGTSTHLKIIVVERNNTRAISLFPNPASSHITIQGDDFSRIEIYDSNLRMVKSFKTNIIDIQDLEQGIYLAYIYCAGKITVRKIAIQRD